MVHCDLVQDSDMLNWRYIKIQSVLRSKHTPSVIKTSQLMLYREIIAVCSQIHTKHIIALYEQNVESLNVKLVVHMLTTGLWRVNYAILNTLKLMSWLWHAAQTTIQPTIRTTHRGVSNQGSKQPTNQVTRRDNKLIHVQLIWTFSSSLKKKCIFVAEL